jgi:hypothetical protein
VGDFFNLPSISWEEGRATGPARRLLEASEEAGLSQLVEFPTHRKGNLLDLILTDCPEKFIQIKDEGCLGSSDHCIITAEIEIELQKQKKTPRNIWNRGNYGQIRMELDTVDWINEINGRDLETAWKFLKENQGWACRALSVTKLSLQALFCNALKLSLFICENIAVYNGLRCNG